MSSGRASQRSRRSPACNVWTKRNNNNNNNNTDRGTVRYNNNNSNKSKCRDSDTSADSDSAPGGGSTWRKQAVDGSNRQVEVDSGTKKTQWATRMIHVSAFGRRYRFKPRTLIKVFVLTAAMVAAFYTFVLPELLPSGGDRRLKGSLHHRAEPGGAGESFDLDDALWKKAHSGKIYLTKGKLGNFEPPEEAALDLPGERGEAVRDFQGDPSFQVYGINMRVSEAIRMNRTIPDTRPDECRYWVYPEDLPSATVILVFHNEGLSVVLRTIHTIFLRSPPRLLHEILLVDDFSDKPDLGDKLESEIRQFGHKVRLVRNKEREGLIRSRSIGAQEARGEVIVFLDAHCEPNKNWLVPLLARVYENPKVMAVPLIDGIDMNTFEYRQIYDGWTKQLAGTFEWGLLYKETPISAEEQRRRTHRSEPWRSPTHAGGLFAISRQFFLALGGYDKGLEIWGGENFELSFKIWMCGGGIEWVPCSRVGHVYRAFMPYSLGSKATGNVIDMNYKRVVEVWMDEYKQYFYTRKPEALAIDPGDIGQQIEWRRTHKCKSFKWYMENVAYQVLTEYPILPPNQAWGSVSNPKTRLCIDVRSGQPGDNVGVNGCNHGGNQLLRLNKEGQFAHGERCIDTDRNHIVKVIFCELGTVHGPWTYTDAGQLQHTKSKLCLETRVRQLAMAPCDQVAPNQVWDWEHVLGSS